MAGSVIDELVILLKADASGVDEGVSQMGNSFKKGLSDITKNFIAPLSAMLGAGKLFNNFTQSADKIAKFSRSLGVNAEDLQAWQEAAKRAGGSVEEFQGSVRTLQKNIMNAATGVGLGASAFQKFGIDVKDANGKAKDSFQVLEELAGKAETMGKNEFVGLAQSLRLDQGTIQLLQEGREGVRKLVEEQRKFGVYSQEDLDAAENFNNALDNFKQSTQVAAAKIFSGLLPPLNAVIGAFSKIVAFVSKNKAIFRGAVFAAMAVTIANKVIPAIKKLQTAAALKNFGTWAKLAAIFTALYLVVEDFVVWLEGGESALEGLWSQFGTAEEVKAKLESLKNTFMDLFKGLSKHAPLLGKIATLIIGIGAALSIVSMIKKVAVAFKALSAAAMMFNSTAWANPYVLIIGAIIAAIGLLIYYWDDVTAAAQRCWQWMKDTWGTFSDWFLGIWDKVGEGLKNWWNGIIEFFVGGWRNMIDGLMKYVPDWIKKRFMSNGEEVNISETPMNEQTAANGTGMPRSDISDTLAGTNAPAAATAGLPVRNTSTTNNNDVDVVFNVNADNPQELGAAVKQKEKSGGWFSRLFSGNDSVDTAYGVATGNS